jgi:hypothetical protein
MSIFSRQAVVACARSNNSILSVSNLSIPTQSPLADLSDFQLALGWLLNYTAADLPPASSIVFSFWNYDSSLSEHDWSLEAYETLKSILAFTTWFFNENNFGNPQLGVPSEEEHYFLPTDFHTTASTATPSIRFIINRKMFMVYIVLQGLPVLFCWGVMLWPIMGKLQRVKTSSFPLLDFIFKAERQEKILPKMGRTQLKEKENKSRVIDKATFQLQYAGDRKFIKELKDVEVVVLGGGNVTVTTV